MQALRLLATCSLCAALGALPAQALGAQELQVQATDGHTALSLGGQAFHTTPNTVVDAKLIPVSGDLVVATWNEQTASGDTLPHYGISLDGQTFAAVKATSYEIKMNRARFDPAQSIPDFGSSPLASGGQVYFVQFETQALFEYREALESLGATVYSHIVNHTYITRMSSSTRAQVAALPFVRWVGEYHPEYRLEPALLANLDTGLLEPGVKVNVMTFESGPTQKGIVADRVQAMGGSIVNLPPSGYSMVVEVDSAQLAELVTFDEVAAVDRYSEGSTDMDIVRQIGGADYVEAVTGFTGQGVRGEAMDTGVLTTHQDFQHNGGVLIHGGNDPFSSHGTSVTGIVFGDGTGMASARGMLPTGKIIFAAYTQVPDRLAHTVELTNPGLPYRAVFQTNSWGASQTPAYTIDSANMDNFIYQSGLLIHQSQSNTGNTNSRPQAWAKNIIAVGGIHHQNTLTKADDNWGSASIGPAADGRLKPDLSFFYDSILTTSSSGGYTFSFGGTSAATPEAAGHSGMFFHLWHNGVFGNATAGDVFDSRPSFTVAKAALVNTAQQYTFNGVNHNLTRTHQGWGLPDLMKLYDTRNQVFVVNETDTLDNLATNSYQINVGAGTSEFKATMVYREQQGVVGAQVARLNDLSLRVTSPGGTVYWGNNGLLPPTCGRPSGGSANDKSTPSRTSSSRTRSRATGPSTSSARTSTPTWSSTSRATTPTTPCG